MQRRVREHSIEFARKGEVLAIHDAGVEPARLRCGDHVGPSIDRDDLRAGSGDLFGQHAVATAEIENALAGSRRQQFEYGRAEGGNE